MRRKTQERISPHKGDTRLVQRDARGRIVQLDRVNKNKPIKSERNLGKPWTAEDLRELKTLAKGNTPTRVLGMKLGRSEAAVRAKAHEAGISLKPTNQPPNKGRKSKSQAARR